VGQVHDALSAAIPAAIPDEMVTRWVCLIETIDERGKRALWLQSADGMQAWDHVGMLRYALDVELAGTVHDRFQERDDG
jgi:hypothetical protein